MTLLLLLSIGLGTPVEIPDMFNKGQRIDKLVIRNQVSYHFKKVIREVSQELFVSRKVDLSALLHGIQILEQTKDTMKQYCYDLAYAEASSAKRWDLRKFKSLYPQLLRRTNLEVIHPKTNKHWPLRPPHKKHEQTGIQPSGQETQYTLKRYLPLIGYYYN